MNIQSKILCEIKSLHDNAIRQADNNLRQALKNEDFKKLYFAIKSLNFDIAKKEFSKLDCESEKQKLKNTEKEMEHLLKKLKFNENLFTPQFSCKKCNDTGFYNNKLCACYFKKLNAYHNKNLVTNINKEHLFESSNFEIFDKPEEYKKTYSLAKKWCDKFFETKKKNIVLTGNTGVGKTYLVECMANELIKKDISVGFYTSFALNNLFLKFHTTFDNTKSSILEPVLNCDVLIIDDLGSEQKYRNVTEEYTYLVANERLMNGKSTIITSNLSLSQILDYYGERTFSRLSNKQSSITFNLVNSDLRRKK